MNTLDCDQQEFFEYYKIQFSKDIVLLEKSIFALREEESFSEAAGNIFRIFHNLKANSQYIGLNNIAKLLHKAERVMCSVKEENLPANEMIVRWLRMVKDQMLEWESLLKQNVLPQTHAKNSLLNAVTFGQIDKSSSTFFRQLNIVYMDANIKRATKIVSALSKKIEKIVHVQNLKELSELLTKDDFHICILNDEEHNFTAVSHCSEKYPSMISIAVFNDINCKNQFTLRKNDLKYLLTNPMKGNILKKMFLDIIETHFISYSYLIEEHEISSFINTLSMIPSSMQSIVDTCEDDEKGIKDLIKVITIDPVFSSYILESTYKYELLKKDMPLNMLISQLGKQSIKALALKHLSIPLEGISLHSYGIDPDEFSRISFLRKKLMIYWYAKVSISSLSILATTSLIGNIGQFLLSQALIDKGRSEDFAHEIKEHGILFCEEKYLHTSTARISSDIFKHWRLNKQIIDSVRYSDYPQSAPMEIHDLALANHIVFQLVQLDGTLQKEIPQHIKTLLEDNNLDILPLKNALKKIQS